jgi:hypothetical protein
MWTIRLQFLAAQIFIFSANLRSNELCPLGTDVSFPEGKVSGRKAGLSYSSSAKYKEVWSSKAYILYNVRLHGCVGAAVTQWLRYCATNLKVVGSIPDGVIGIFH